MEASKWNVTYSTSPICGLMGSEVTLSCSYTYPSNTIFEKAYWTTMNHVSLGEPPDLSEESRYRGRVQVDSSRDRCTFILSNVSKTDSQDYYCRVVTSEKGQRWLQTPGVTLSVTGNRRVYRRLFPYDLLSPCDHLISSWTHVRQVKTN